MVKSTAMKRHALFVGVDRYADGHIPNLSCAVNDATDLNGFFKFGAGYDRVELLPNPAGKKEVLSAVRSLTSGLDRGDFFLFFFAGHGFRVGENHVLVCANDLYEDVKYEDDGLPLGQLKRRLSGAFDSALLLDACQSDILATRGGEGIAERDLSLILETPFERRGCGALTVVTSCDAGQTAAELSERRHGLFTTALLDLLKEAQGAHARLPLSDAFRVSLGRRMGEIAARYGLPSEQRPRFSCTGDSCFVLLEGGASSPREREPATLPDSALVVCPVCGKKNRPENTFKCLQCGRDNLCLDHRVRLDHRDKTTYLCDDCARKAKEALDWFRKGEDFLNGSNGCRQDHDEAVKCYRRAADSGNREACHKYGDLLFNGRLGVERNVSAALKYYLKADQSNVWIPFNIGSCYLHFYEKTRKKEDGRRAVEWLRKSADAGVPWACVKLGDCHRDGIGVSRDLGQARKWYGKALDAKGVATYGDLGAVYWAKECLAEVSAELLLERIGPALGQDWEHFRLVYGARVRDSQGRDVPLAGPVASDLGVFIGVTPEGLRLDANAPLPAENPAWPFALSVSEHCGIPLDWFIAALVLPDSYPEPNGGLPFWAIRESNAATAMLGMKPTDRYLWDNERQDIIRRLETLPMSSKGAERNALLHFEAPVPEWGDGLELLKKINEPSEWFIARTAKVLDGLPVQNETPEATQVKNWLAPFRSRP
jgi:tetratricopeptide (TPR) repeat protein